MAQAAESFFIKLPDTFAAEAKFVCNFFKCVRLAATESEAQTQDVTLARCEFA